MFIKYSFTRRLPPPCIFSHPSAGRAEVVERGVVGALRARVARDVTRRGRGGGLWGWFGRHAKKVAARRRQRQHCGRAHEGAARREERARRHVPGVTCPCQQLRRRPDGVRRATPAGH